MSRPLYLIIFSLMAFAAILFQPLNLGFAPGHHGWVSSHAMAIQAKATPANGFVGYTYRTQTASGTTRTYFDRYPPFFSAFLHGWTHLFTAPTLHNQLTRARLLMLLIFAGTFAGLVATLRQLGTAWPTAFAIAALALSGTGFAHYKDMIHYDQPALLMITWLWWAILKSHASGRTRLAWVLALAATVTGRGYAAFATLIAWWLWQLAHLWRTRRPRNFAHATRQVFTLSATHIGLVCALWCGSWLAYNIATESATSNIPWSQTSIVDSAHRRFINNHIPSVQYLTQPHYAVASQVRNLGLFALPRPLDLPAESNLIWLAAGGIVMVTLGTLLWRRRKHFTARQQLALALLIGSGPLFTIPFKGLTIFHEYTGMYYLGAIAAFWWLLVGHKKLPTWVAMLCILLLPAGHVLDQLHTAPQRIAAELELTNLAPLASLAPTGPILFHAPEAGRQLPRRPYLLAFVLPHAVWTPDPALATSQLKLNYTATGLVARATFVPPPPAQ